MKRFSVLLSLLMMPLMLIYQGAFADRIGENILERYLCLYGYTMPEKVRESTGSNR